MGNSNLPLHVRKRIETRWSAQFKRPQDAQANQLLDKESAAGPQYALQGSAATLRRSLHGDDVEG